MPRGGMGFNVSVKGDVNIGKDLQMGIDGFVKDIIEDVARRTQLSIKLRAPRHSGALRNSIMVYPTGKNQMRIDIGSGLPRGYALYQEYGYRGHLVSKKKHPEVEHLPGPGNFAAIRTKPSNMEGYYVGPAMKMVPTFIQRASDLYFKKNFGSRK